MIHHSQYISNIDCEIILAEAAKEAGFDRRENKYKNALYEIAKVEMIKSNEVVSYSTELQAVGKGSPLAQAIFKHYRRKSRRK